MEKKFINNEIWLLTRGGAFQRSGIYNPEVSDKLKREFGLSLKEYLDNLINSQYQEEISEEKHIENIEGIIDFSLGFDKVLKNGLNFGVSQKLLNLYLKYHWCLDEIPAPPHFPVDRIIQEKLKLKVIPWTKMVGIKGREDYIRIVESAKEKLKEHKCEHVAELELKLFNRNSETDIMRIMV